MAATTDSKLYIFGGLECHHRTNSLASLDLTSRTWQHLLPTGELPCPRSFGACWVYKSRLYIHGGETDEFTLAPPRTTLPFEAGERKERLGLAGCSENEPVEGRVCADDLFCYDPDVNRWNRIINRLGPMPRRSHTINVVDNPKGGGEQAVLFGGLQGGK